MHIVKNKGKKRQLEDA